MKFGDIFPLLLVLLILYYAAMIAMDLYKARLEKEAEKEKTPRRKSTFLTKPPLSSLSASGVTIQRTLSHLHRQNSQGTIQKTRIKPIPTHPRRMRKRDRKFLRTTSLCKTKRRQMKRRRQRQTHSTLKHTKSPMKLLPSIARNIRNQRTNRYLIPNLLHHPIHSHRIKGKSLFVGR